MPVRVEDIPLKIVCPLPAIPQALDAVSLVPVPQQEPLQFMDDFRHLRHTVECNTSIFALGSGCTRLTRR